MVLLHDSQYWYGSSYLYAGIWRSFGWSSARFSFSTSVNSIGLSPASTGTFRTRNVVVPSERPTGPSTTRQTSTAQNMTRPPATVQTLTGKSHANFNTDFFLCFTVHTFQKCKVLSYNNLPLFLLVWPKKLLLFSVGFNSQVKAGTCDSSHLILFILTKYFWRNVRRKNIWDISNSPRRVQSFCRC